MASTTAENVQTEYGWDVKVKMAAPVFTGALGSTEITRRELMSLTRECAEVTGIPYVMDAYRDEALEIIES